jgi:hypothetical protein
MRTPSTSSAACTRLRCLWLSWSTCVFDFVPWTAVYTLHIQLLQSRFVAHRCVSISSTSLRIRHVRTLFVGPRPLRLRALAFDVSGIASLRFCLADFVPFAFGFCGFIRRVFGCDLLNLSPSFDLSGFNSTCGSIPPAFSVSFPCVSLRFDVVDLPSHSVSSRSFGLAFDFSIHLRLRIVSFRPVCLQLHSTSTLLHISGRSGAATSRRGSRPPPTKQTTKTQNQKPTKKPRNNHEAAKEPRSRCRNPHA